MAHNKLEIKLLSKSGELLRAVNCFSGQATVLRAHAASDLEPYRRALAGTTGPERFSISLDSEPYSPNMSILIGFGESYNQEHRTPIQLLEEVGFPDSAARSALMSYGLEDIADKAASELTRDQERRMRLLLACNTKDKILVLNNPFEVIVSEWRERFAELVISSTRQKDLIVLVTSLAHRPESWIDNETVARTQVGETRQRTIGFSSDPNLMRNIVSEVRSGLGQEKDSSQVSTEAEEAPAVFAPIQPGQPAQPTQPPPQQPLSSGMQTTPHASGVFGSTAMRAPSSNGRSPIIPAAVALGTLAIVLTIFWPEGEPSTDTVAKKTTEESTDTASLPAKKSPEVVKKSQPPKKAVLAKLPEQPDVKGSKPPKKDPAIEKVITPPKAETPVVKATPRRAPPSPRKRYVLDMYPKDIKESILLAFEGPRSGSSRSSGFQKTPTQKKEEKATSDLFTALAATSGSGEHLKDTPYNPKSARRPNVRRPKSSSTSNEDPEERRERIRKKFLEAIERAAAKRGQ